MRSIYITKSSKNSCWDYFLISVFLLTSGVVFWLGILSISVAFLFLLICGVIGLVRTKTPLFGNKSYMFIIFVVLWCLLNAAFVDNRGYKTNSMMGYIVVLMAAYVVISQYDFYKFRDILTNIVFFITAIGIPVYLCFYMFDLPTIYFPYQDGTIYCMIGPYTLGWPYLFERYSGIWHEPGAGQIILNTILWLNFDKIVKRKYSRMDVCKYLVIVLGLLLSKSTGAYMVLMLFVFAIFTNMKIRKKYKAIIYPLLLLVTVVVLIVMFNTDVIQDKLFAKSGVNGSTQARSNDITALWKVALNYPIFGAGLGTNLFWFLSTKLGNTANSSGFMTYLASLGFPWAICFIVACWNSIKYLRLGKASIYLLIAILLMQFNECFIEFPITSIFIFKFKSYLNYET